MSDIELDNLSSSPSTTGPQQSEPDLPLSRDSESVLYWASAAAVILSATATVLILFPRFLLFLAEGNGVERRVTLTPLESFLALHTGILLVAVALALLLNVPNSTPAARPQQLYALGHPLLASLSGVCTIIAIVSYNTRSVGPLTLLVSFGSGTIAVWGIWVMLFEGTSTISRKTGADKHTSRFIFGNKAAASSQKKQWKRQQAQAKTR